MHSSSSSWECQSIRPFLVRQQFLVGQHCRLIVALWRKAEDNQGIGDTRQILKFVPNTPRLSTLTFHHGVLVVLRGPARMRHSVVNLRHVTHLQ